MSNQVILASLDLTPAALVIEHVFGVQFYLRLEPTRLYWGQWEDIKDLCIIATGKSNADNRWQQESAPLFMQYKGVACFWHVVLKYNDPKVLQVMLVNYSGHYYKASQIAQSMPWAFTEQPYLSKGVKFK